MTEQTGTSENTFIGDGGQSAGRVPSHFKVADGAVRAHHQAGAVRVGSGEERKCILLSHFKGPITRASKTCVKCALR
jgi:hypothetical protein